MSQFKVGDVVKDSYKKVGRVVYIHPIDSPDLVVDYGNQWAGAYSEDTKIATSKQAEKFLRTIAPTKTKSPSNKEKE